jgi:hypothetical protein
MAELLELNVRAKKAKPPAPPPQAAAEGLVLEIGKKYITNDGTVIGPMKVETEFPGAADKWVMSPIDGGFNYNWEINGGEYVGAGMEHKKSIRREWTPTWELEEAWMRGEKLEYFESIDGVWRLWNPYSYALIQNTFGKDSITTKEFWAKSYAYQCIREDGTFRVRRKP